MDWYRKTVHDRLIEAAKTDEEFVTYKEIIVLAELGHLTGEALGGALGHVFYAIVQEDLAQDPDRPMLPAVAVRTHEMVPGPGLYRLARDMGKLQSTISDDEIAFWIEEARAVRTYWQSKAK